MLVPLRFALDGLSHEAHPGEVAGPCDGSALAKAFRNSAEGLLPPYGLLEDPGRPATNGVTELPQHPENRDGNELPRRTAHQHAPKFVACMSVVHAHFIALRTGEVVPDLRTWFEADLPACADTAQGEVGFLVRVKEKVGISADLEECSFPNGGAGVGEAADELRWTKV